MKAAFLSPYLDILGGGEKYLLDIAKSCSQLGLAPVLFWPNQEIKKLLLERFGQEYSFIQIDNSWFKLSPWQRILKTKEYAAFFYHPDGSYFYSLAKKNFALLQVPNKNLVNNTSLPNKIKFSCWTPVYNSHFTKRYFQKILGSKKGTVLYPTISEPISADINKENLIISVGRFFKHLHSKRQDVLIHGFNFAQKTFPEFKNYQLLLIGSYQPNDRRYFNYLKKLALYNRQIHFAVNVSQEQLKKYYRRAKFYWHAAGYKINEKTEPEKAEHFGISIVEAMSYGTVPIAYAAGGPKETVLNGKDGFLIHKRLEYATKTKLLISNQALWQKFSIAAKERAQEKFGRAKFSKNLTLLLGKI